MKNVIIKISFILFLFICICDCSLYASLNNFIQDIRDTASKPPEFKDAGQTADGLKKEYSCEAIEYENWEDNDDKDSALTVCLINSSRIPAANFDEGLKQLKAIASKIKKAVKHPELYKSYYIIFIKRKIYSECLTTNSHAMGAHITASEL